MEYRFDGDELRRRMIAAGFVNHPETSPLDDENATPALIALAEAVGVTERSVYYYLHGRKMPGGVQLAKLAAALGCDVWDLLTPVGDEVAS